MIAITPQRPLKVEENYKNTSIMKAGVTYIVPDAFKNEIMKSVGSVFKSEPYLPTNFYRGEDLTNKSLSCFRSGGIGDLLFITTSLKELKKKYPTARLYLGCNSAFGEILKSPTGDYEIISMPLEKSILDANDYVLFFQGIIEEAKEAETVNAYDLFRKAFYLDGISNYKPNVYLSDNYMADVNKYLKKNQPFYEKQINIAIQVSASVPKRSILPATLIQFINSLPSQYSIWLIGSSSQMDEINEILQSTKEHGNVYNVSQCLPKLGHVAALLSKVQLAVGPDSSLLHMAGGLGIPMIGLFGAFPSVLRLSHYDHTIGIDSNTDCEFSRGEGNLIGCFEHGSGPCRLALKKSEFYSPCMKLITSDHILQAMQKLGFCTSEVTSTLSDAFETDSGKLNMNKVYDWSNAYGYKLKLCNEGETSKFHNIILECISNYKGSIDPGNILDVGCGMDQLLPNCDTFDMDKPYTSIDPIELTYRGDAETITKYVNKKYDILYSSHLLEDFENTTTVLNEWKKIIKDDGIMVLLLPDQQRYVQKCKIFHEKPNEHHKIDDFGLGYMKEQCKLAGLGVIRGMELFSRNDPKDLEYNFLIVSKISQSATSPKSS
ncbi:MAG: glycosyltransferase family 9 protein [Smithella sp.]